MRKAKVWDARQLPAYLTVVQYGELMGICPKTVRRMCQRGELPAHKEGPRLWRIDKNAALEQRQDLRFLLRSFPKLRLHLQLLHSYMLYAHCQMRTVAPAV